MTDYLLLILSVFANVTYSSLCNHFGKKTIRDPRDVFRINFWIDVSVSVMLLGYVIVTGAGFSLFTVLLGNASLSIQSSARQRKPPLKMR